MRQEKALEIKCTTNLAQFKFWNEQRFVNSTNMRRVMRSMQKYGYDATKPIVVNAKMEIVDGQHRLMAARELGIGVYYIVSEKHTLEMVREEAIATKAWDISDFITSYANQGNPNYIRVLRSKERSGVGWSTFFIAFLPEDAVDYNGAGAVKEGKLSFTVADEEAVGKMADDLKLMSKYIKHWNTRSFARAFTVLYRHTEFRMDLMLKKMEYASKKVVRTLQSSVALENLIEVYNYKQHEDNRIDPTPLLRQIARR